MHSLKLGLSLAVVAGGLLSLSACSPEAKLKELISAQIEEEKEKEEEEKKAAAQAVEDSRTPVERSQHFLKDLEALMEGYQPVLPALDDQTDLLKCVTDYQFTANDKLKASKRALSKKKKNSEKARDKAFKNFQSKRYLQYRIDHDWEKRVADKAYYGCWDKEDYYWHDDSRADCTQYYQTWRLRSASDSFGNTGYTAEGQGLYSQTETPAPPELMKRMETAELESPERFYCQVNEVTAPTYVCFYDGQWDWDLTRAECLEPPPGSWRVYKDRGLQIECSTAGATLSIKVSGEWEEGPTVNRGDVVSAPLAEVSVDPSGVLGMSKEMSWVLAANGDSLKVETAAECPSVEDILAAK